jgi:hypothetical protein
MSPLLQTAQIAEMIATGVAARLRTSRPSTELLLGTRYSSLHPAARHSGTDKTPFEPSDTVTGFWCNLPVNPT